MYQEWRCLSKRCLLLDSALAPNLLSSFLKDECFNSKSARGNGNGFRYQTLASMLAKISALARHKFNLLQRVARQYRKHHSAANAANESQHPPCPWWDFTSFLSIIKPCVAHLKLSHHTITLNNDPVNLRMLLLATARLKTFPQLQTKDPCKLDLELKPGSWMKLRRTYWDSTPTKMDAEHSSPNSVSPLRVSYGRSKRPGLDQGTLCGPRFSHCKFSGKSSREMFMCISIARRARFLSYVHFLWQARAFGT